MPHTTTVGFVPHVLVVADEPWVINDVRASLGEPRFSLTEHDDARSAIDACQSEDVDAVVVDLQVRSMGGMAIIRAIREVAGDGGPLPTILLLDRRADAFLARRAGAGAWIHKPFTAFELRGAIDGLLDGEDGSAA